MSTVAIGEEVAVVLTGVFETPELDFDEDTLNPFRAAIFKNVTESKIVAEQYR